MNEFNKSDKLSSVERDLYSKNSNIERKPRKELTERQYDLNQTWKSDEKQIPENNPLKEENNKGISAFTKILIVAFIFFVGALVYALYVFQFSGGPEVKNVNISINAPVSVAAGEQFVFDVIVENNNVVDMKTIDLVLEYPDGTRDGDDITVDLSRDRKDLGDLDSGSIIRNTETIHLFGEEGDKKEIEVKIVYRVADSNAVFEKRKVFEVVLKSTPVRANVASVKSITAGQGLEFDVEIISNSNETLDNLIIKAEYPFGFLFSSSTYGGQITDNVWIIDKLEPKETLKFKVKGELQGQNSDDKFFRFNVGLRDTEDRDEIGVLFTTVGKTITVERPFLEIDVAVDGKSSDVINLESNKTYQMKISYKNNTGLLVKDAEVELIFNGDVLDEESVRVSNGFYQSSDNTARFDKTTFSEFSELDIGESDTLDFIFKTKPLNGLEVFKNPEISIRAIVKGKRVLEDDVPQEIQNEILKKLRFNTVVSLDSNSLYYDGPFTNQGPIPPKVDQRTTYTISFAVSNSSNRISNGAMEMSLPNYVNWEGATWPSGEEVGFDSNNRKVVWKIGEIKESSGLEGRDTQIAFQISIVPSITQSGSAPILVDDIIFIGNDLFTGEQIRREVERITILTADQRNSFDGRVSQ
jgi:hypothetical protein